jgi:hypothetical protein
MRYEIKYNIDLAIIETKIEGMKNSQILVQVIESAIKASAEHGTNKFLFDTRLAVGNFRLPNLRRIVNRLDEIGFKKHDRIAILTDFTSIEGDTAILLANHNGWKNLGSFTYKDEAIDWLLQKPDNVSSIAM